MTHRSLSDLTDHTSSEQVIIKAEDMNPPQTDILFYPPQRSHSAAGSFYCCIMKDQAEEQDRPLRLNI